MRVLRKGAAFPQVIAHRTTRNLEKLAFNPPRPPWLIRSLCRTKRLGPWVQKTRTKLRQHRSHA
jgi:hypothetical protein